MRAVVIATIAQIVGAGVLCAGRIAVTVRPSAGNAGASGIYVAVVREDAPWREPVAESVLEENARSIGWTLPVGHRVVLIPDGKLPDGLSRDVAMALWTRPTRGATVWRSLPPGQYRIALDHSLCGADAVPRVVGSVDLAAGGGRVLAIASLRESSVVAGTPSTKAKATLFLANADAAARRAAVSQWNVSEEKSVVAKPEEVSGGVRLHVADCHAGVRYLVRTQREVAVVSVRDDEDCGKPLPAPLRPAADAVVRLLPPSGAPLPARAIARVASCGTRGTPLGEYPVVIGEGGVATFPFPAGCTAATLLVDGFAPVFFAEATTSTGARHEFPAARLVQGGVILARVVAADGSPVDGVAVAAILADELEGARAIETIPPLTTAVTRGGGWARMTGIPSREVVLLLAPGGRRNPQVSLRYRVDAGQQLLVDPLELLTPATLTVSVDAAGASEHGVELLNATLSSGNGNRWPKRTPLQALFDSEHATFADIPAGEWKIAVYGRLPGQLATIVGSTTVTVLPGQATEAAVKMARTAHRGRVLLRGHGVRGMLTLRAPAVSPVTVPADREGRFTALLEVGTYEAELVQNAQEGPLGYVQATDVTVPDGDEEIRIELPAARLAGRVVSEESDPVVGATVRARSLRFRGKTDGPARLAEPELEVRSGDDGRFAFEAVAAGAWTLEAVYQKQQSDRPAVVLAERQDLGDVILHLSGIEEVGGQVIDSRGLPAAGAQVVVSMPEMGGALPRMDWTKTGERGEFTLALRTSAVGASAEVKIRTRDGAVASMRRNMTDPLLIQLRPSGDVEIEQGETEGGAPLLEVLVGPDGATLSVPFCSTSRFVRDGRQVLRITQLEVGEWRYVTARTEQEVAAVIHGAALMLRPAAAFTVHPAQTTVVSTGSSR